MTCPPSVTAVSCLLIQRCQSFGFVSLQVCMFQLILWLNDDSRTHRLAREMLTCQVNRHIRNISPGSTACQLLDCYQTHHFVGPFTKYNTKIFEPILYFRKMGLPEFSIPIVKLLISTISILSRCTCCN